MRLQTLAQHNPWWDGAGRIDSDRQLVEHGQAPVPWVPRLLHRFSLGQDRVYTLRGPRQVGKTTLVKLLVRRLAQEEHVDPRAILYYSCEDVGTPKALDDLVETYLRWPPASAAKRRFLFLDEISSVPRWSKAFLALANRGRLRGCTVVLTGSHALDVIREVERLPGRRGEGADVPPDDLLDKVLLPMKFAEYAEIQSPEVRRALQEGDLLQKPSRMRAFDDVYAGLPNLGWSELQLRADLLDRLLADYLLTGGFPRPLNEFRRHGRIPRETFELYVRTFTADLARWDYEQRTVRELLAAIVDRIGSPVSWRMLAEETDAGTHVTVGRYIESLERTYTVQTVYQYDPRRKRPSVRKHRKLYIPDPFLFHALRGWALGIDDPFEAAVEFLADPPRRGLLLEAVVGDHLARLAFATHPSVFFDAYEHVMFWRSKKGWEVDFVLRDGARPKAIQLTLTRPRPETRRALHAFGGGVVVTERGEGESIPLAPLLCLV